MAVQPHPEWRVIVGLIQTREYGESIPHAEIAAATGLSYGTQRYFQQVQRARRVLLTEWRKELETLKGTGYRLVNPDEFNGRFRRQLRLAGRPIRQGLRVLVAAPAERLTDAQNAQNSDALAKMGALESLRKRTAAETRPSLPPHRPADTPRLLQTSSG